MSPIVAEMRRLFGDQWKPTVAQAWQLENPFGDPQEIADCLADQLTAYRKQTAQQLGWPDHWDLIDPAFVDDMLILNTATRTVDKGTNPSSAEDKLTGQEAFDIGFTMATQTKVGGMTVLYRLIFGRLPDPAGLIFYVKCLSDGVSLAFITADMEANKAKGAV